MSYTVPALSVAVELTGGYTAPDLSVQVILGAEAVADITGALNAALPVSNPPLTLAATGARDRNWLAATWPSVSLPALIFRARERDITVTLAVTLPALALPLTLTGQADYLHPLTLSAAFPAPDGGMLTLTGAGDQDLVLPDAAGPRLATPQQSSVKAGTGAGLQQQAMLPAHRGLAVRSESASPIRVGQAWRQAPALRVDRALAERHAQGRPVQAVTGIPATEALRTRRALAERYAQQLPMQTVAGLWATDTVRTATHRALSEAPALPLTWRLTVGQQQATVTARRLQVRWAHAERPQPGRWWPFYEVPLLTGMVLHSGYMPRPLHCRVALSWRVIAQPYCEGFDPDPDPPTIIVPLQEVYLVINSFSFARADTGQVVDALDFSATLDADAWGWSWSATIPATQEGRVRSPALGEFVELIATLNGTALRVVVEKLSRSRAFGQATLKISGRGRAAWLAEPHSPMITVMNTETRTAQQLLNEALMINGVSLGWTVDWQVEDWSVPAGLWSYTGTSIGAAQRLAEAAGGYVQADAALQTLHIVPYYPAAPWGWETETPDIALPEAVCTTEGIEWQDKPGYNAVWVVGQTQGRRDLVKRTGTAGDRLAPTVVDPLATDTVMTRQRGLRVIADTGRQVHISVQLPILEDTGIILPGRLLEYTEQGVTHRGLSRAVSVTYGFPQAWQTIKVETHELESV